MVSSQGEEDVIAAGRGMGNEMWWLWKGIDVDGVNEEYVRLIWRMRSTRAKHRFPPAESPPSTIFLVGTASWTDPSGGYSNAR